MVIHGRISLIALVTFSLYSQASVLAATAGAERRIVLTGLGQSVSFEHRNDASGHTYVAAVIQNGSRKAEISITPAEIVFNDGYSILRKVETHSQSEHAETLTAFSPDHEKSATIQIRIKGGLVTILGRREVAQLLDASASFRLLAESRWWGLVSEFRFELRGMSEDCSVQLMTLTRLARCGSKDARLAESASYVWMVAGFTEGGESGGPKHTSLQAEDLALEGLRLDLACSKD